jgi:hypothetical protein
MDNTTDRKTGSFREQLEQLPAVVAFNKLLAAGRGGGDAGTKRGEAAIVVRKGGLEPPRPYGRSHLKAVRLPISPLPLDSIRAH